LSQNATTKVEPSVVHFAGYSLNKIQTCRIKICNSSAERQNFHIIPPATKHFSIKYTKPVSQLQKWETFLLLHLMSDNDNT